MRDAIAISEDARRIYVLSHWPDTSFFSDKKGPY
ncbi:hypothetical protein [Sphingobacterium prati]